MQPRFSILIPVFNHGELLRYSLECVRRQTATDWELFIIGDGATEKTEAVAREFAAKDARITFVKHPKHESRGEPYRHELLTTRARGRFICYSCDDDLWLPGHLEYMAELLETSDWAHPLSCYLDEHQELQVRPLDLQMPFYRTLMLGRENRIGLTSMAHTMEFYKRLPHGWRTTPEPWPTDHYMYQQFLQMPKFKVMSGLRPTLLNFPDGFRKHYQPGQKLAELKYWFSRMQEQDFEQYLTEQLLHAAYRKTVELESELTESRDEVLKHNGILKADYDGMKKNYEHYRNDARELRELAMRYQHDITVLQQALQEERYRRQSESGSIWGRLFSGR